MGDLRDRTPGHGLIQRLLTEFEKGRIHLSANPKWLEVEVEDGAESWYRGVLGERCVGQILSALPDTWTVLHSVPVGHGNRDIDHVVIGPGGVFTINTKYSPGKDVWARGIGLLVGGHRTRYVFKACEEARDAAQRLTAAIDARVSVTGIIVFVEPGRMRVQPPVGDQLTVVKVVRDTDLLDSLHSRDPLTSQKIARIVEAAVRPETWHERPEAEPRLGAHLALEFDALQEHIEPGHDGPKSRPVAAPPRVPWSRPQRSVRVAAARSAPPRRPNRRRNKRQEDALARGIAGLILAAVAVVGSQIWLHQQASGSAPAPTPTSTVTTPASTPPPSP